MMCVIGFDVDIFKQVSTPTSKRTRRVRKDNDNEVIMTVRKFAARAADFIRGAGPDVPLYQCPWKHGGYNSADFGLHVSLPEFLATKADDGYPTTLAGLAENGMKLVFTGKYLSGDYVPSTLTWAKMARVCHRRASGCGRRGGWR